MITILALNAFSNYLRDDVLNVEPVHSYIMGDTIYTWSVENFQLVRKHVVEKDDAHKAAGFPYWLVLLCAREKIEVSSIQKRHFAKVWTEDRNTGDGVRHEFRMAHLAFHFNIYSNSIKVIEDVEELILTSDPDKTLEITVPGLFENPAEPMSINIANFTVSELKKGDSHKSGTMTYLQCSGAMDYPLLLARGSLPLILTPILTVNFSVDLEV